MNVLTPTQQASAMLDGRQSDFSARHTARVADIAREIGHDPIRLASALREASGDHLYAFCEQLIACLPSRPGLATALSNITTEAARDEA